jgi:hypothetical protein
LSGVGIEDEQQMSEKANTVDIRAMRLFGAGIEARQRSSRGRKCAWAVVWERMAYGKENRVGNAIKNKPGRSKQRENLQ